MLCTRCKPSAARQHQVPVAMIDGEVLVDSSAIISRIAAETDAEAAAAQPPPKQGWFSRGKPAQPAAAVSHTGQHSLQLP